MKARIYHNPRCSKSRATLQLLEERGVEVDVVEYLETPPTQDELREACRKLGKHPRDVVRFKEGVARELGLDPGDGRTEDEWLALLVAHPVLLERPIVVVGDEAALGRPPENVAELLEARG